jgi:hypothetical protein
VIKTVFPAAKVHKLVNISACWGYWHVKWYSKPVSSPAFHELSKVDQVCIVCSICRKKINNPIIPYLQGCVVGEDNNAGSSISPGAFNRFLLPRHMWWIVVWPRITRLDNERDDRVRTVYLPYMLVTVMRQRLLISARVVRARLGFRKLKAKLQEIPASLPKLQK